MTVYATVDQVPQWDLLTNFDTLTVADGGMIAGVLRLRPAVAGVPEMASAVGGTVSVAVAVAGDADLRAA